MVSELFIIGLYRFRMFPQQLIGLRYLRTVKTRSYVYRSFCVSQYQLYQTQPANILTSVIPNIVRTEQRLLHTKPDCEMLKKNVL